MTTSTMNMVSSAQSHRIAKESISVSGILTNYYQTGEANPETILLLHGMSSSADTFRDLMAGFGQRYRTVAPDIPGFGESGDTRPYTFPHLVQWLRAFVEAISLSPVHLGGHSFGGALAVSYALAQPEDVRSLILMAPSVLRPGKYPQWLRRFAQSEFAECVLRLGVGASRIMLERQMRAAFYDPSRFEASLWERRRTDYERARASAAVLRASALHDIRSDLHHITQRSCIIWGQNDPVLEPDDAIMLNDLMPESYTDLHMLSECGHIPHIEQKERVITIIDSFLGPT